LNGQSLKRGFIVKGTDGFNQPESLSLFLAAGRRQFGYGDGVNAAVFKNLKLI